jgi:hypothetical protein
MLCVACGPTPALPSFSGNNNSAVLTGPAIGSGTTTNSALQKALSVSVAGPSAVLPVGKAFALRSTSTMESTFVVVEMRNTGKTARCFITAADLVLRDGTGFLTPEDLAEFDQAVHEYMNGEYYRCPATGEELVESVTKLRDKREFDLYYSIVQTFIDTVAQQVKANDPRFTSAAITVEQRPWGRRGELVNCWVVSLLSLLRDAPPNKFQPEGRPSLFSLGTYFEWLL